MRSFLSIALLLVTSTALATYVAEPSIRLADSPAADAFGHLRVSQPTAQVHISQYYDKRPLLLDEQLVGTGSATFQTGESSTILATAASGDAAIQQSYNHGQYQPGKSHIIKMTFSDMQTQSNVIKRVGYFECATTTPFVGTCDGLWFEASDDYYFTAANNGTNTTRVARANWDDPLDGTGPSGETVDFSKAQVFFVDFQWLGVGRVRWGFVLDGLVKVAHSMDHAGVVEFPYMANPNHPIRWDVYQTGAGSGSMRSVCGDIETEGTSEFIGSTHSVSNSTTEVSMSADTSYALVGLSVQDGKDPLTVIPVNASVIATSANDQFEWRVCLNPTVADTFTYNAVTDSPASVAIGAAANTVSDCTATDGKLLTSGFGSTASPVTLASTLRRAIGHSVDGVYDKIVVVVKPFAAADASASLTWEERY